MVEGLLSTGWIGGLLKSVDLAQRGFVSTGATLYILSILTVQRRITL